MTAFAPKKAAKGTKYQLSFMGPKGVSTNVEINDGGNITSVDNGIESITGHQIEELIGTSFYSAPLSDRQKQPGSANSLCGKRRRSRTSKMRTQTKCSTAALFGSSARIFLKITTTDQRFVP